VRHKFISKKVFFDIDKSRRFAYNFYRCVMGCAYAGGQPG
jgi:hypothetical protein